MLPIPLYCPPLGNEVVGSEEWLAKRPRTHLRTGGVYMLPSSSDRVTRVSLVVHQHRQNYSADIQNKPIKNNITLFKA
jgi:hypothetical protein